jgi:hypothetical protein
MQFENEKAHMTYRFRFEDVDCVDLSFDIGNVSRDLLSLSSDLLVQEVIFSAR